MGNSIVKSQLQEVKIFLNKTVVTLETFLNETTLSSLESEQEGSKEYYKAILSNLRRLLVNCEDTSEACSILIKGEPFQKGAAEKTLYRVFHQCVEEFFSPRNDAWKEDSRAAYTGKNSIQFYHPVTQELQDLLHNLEGDFQKVREDLEYYETDYRTKMIQSK